MKTITCLLKKPRNSAVVTLFFLSIIFSHRVSAESFFDFNILFPSIDYDYVPSVIDDGISQHFWWCGGPKGVADRTDVIYYRNYNFRTQQWSQIYAVLLPTIGAWDSAYTCDPSVVQGDFVYDDFHYKYAMYYTGTDQMDGKNNGVGVAFSNDKIYWIKYPTPIKRSYVPDHYGYGGTAVMNGNGSAGVWLWIIHELDGTPTGQKYHLYHSEDGIDFDYQYEVTVDGIDDNYIAQADFAYDYDTGEIYMATGHFNDTSRISLYKIHWSQMFRGRWTKLGTIDSNFIGQPVNHGPGFLRDIYGNLTRWLPLVEVYFSTGTIDTATWELSWAMYQ